MDEVNNTEVMENTEVLPETTSVIDRVDSESSQDLLVGIAGAGIVLLAIPTVIRIGKWIWVKAKAFFNRNKNCSEAPKNEEQ